MSFCATQWMLCKSPVYLEQSEFNPFPNLVGINFSVLGIVDILKYFCFHCMIEYSAKILF